MPDNVSDSAYTTRPLTADTWDDFAKLVEANNGVWGGCWCMGFHPEGVGKEHTASQNRDAKQAHVRQGTVHQVLVYDGQDCVGWCQYGSPAELPNIKNPKAYSAELTDLPDWPPYWLRSSKRAVGSSRHTLNRSRVENHSAAPTSTPAPRTCSRSSVSNATGGSPSGAG
jgi:hypothetical protein